MPGPPPKQPEDRKRRNTPAVGEVHAPPAELVPPAPPGISGPVLEQWHALWTTDVAGAIAYSDVPALHRLFQLREESLAAHDLCRDEPMLEGSQGQTVANPMCRQAVELDKEIRQLEDRFGLTPLARLRLGIAVGDAAKAKRTKERIDEERREGPNRADPRLADT